MHFVTVRQLKNQTSQLLEQSHGGNEVIITKHGTPYALLVPVDEESLEDFILTKHLKLENFFLKIRKNKKNLMTLDEAITARKKLSHGSKI